MKIELKLFQEYLTLKGLSPRTIKEYSAYALRYQTIGAFNSLAISRFLTDKSNQNNVARSFILILKKFLLYYKEEIGITEEEFKEIAQTEVPSISGRKKTKITIPLTPKEIKLLEEQLPTQELKLMLLICFEGGLRLQELIGIRISSFNWERLKEYPEEQGEVRVLGKGNKEGTAILPNWLMKRIKEYLKANSTRFNQSSRLFKIQGRSFEVHLKEAGIKAGLTKKDNNGEYIQSTITHPHRLRHSLAGKLIREGVDIRYIQEALRHVNIASTQRYTQLSKEDLKKKLREINEVGK